MDKCTENPGAHVLKAILEHKKVELSLPMEQTL